MKWENKKEDFLIVQPVISLVIKCISGRGVRTAGRGYMDKKTLIPIHPLSNKEITKYFNNKPNFNGVFSMNNLSRVKDGVHVINLDERKSKEAHQVSLFIDRKTTTYHTQHIKNTR